MKTCLFDNERSDEIRNWLLDFQKSIGHNNVPGCVVCITIKMLISELNTIPQESISRQYDDVTVTGPMT